MSGQVSHMQVLFNTDRYRRTLVTSGVEEKQSEAMTDALSGALGESVATKYDLDLAGRKLQITLYNVVTAQTLVIIGAVIAIIKCMHAGS